MDTLVREHDDRHAADSHLVLITKGSVERALDKYSVDTLPHVYERAQLQQLIRMKDLNFTNREVQATFRINDQSARNRIRTWTDTGAVSPVGTRPAEGGSGGKPANEYSIVDLRIRRVIERHLPLGAEFDSVEESSTGDDGASD